jgi:predicted NUDIX family NTP pyrophosphohydrolase
MKPRAIVLSRDEQAPRCATDVNLPTIPCQERRPIVPKRSAGLLMYRGSGPTLAVLLVHPGGPFWAGKDLGAWSIPKGEYTADEDPLAVARREFAEETGARPGGAFRPLGDVVQAGGKRVSAWAVEGDFDPAALVSNTFEAEWPPRSGRRRSFPEVDRAEWFSPDEARQKINAGQRAFIDRLVELVRNGE